MVKAEKASKSSWLDRIPKKWRAVVAFSFLSLSLVIAVLSGIPNSSTTLEGNAAYIANTINSDAVDGDYLSVIIESEDETEHAMPVSATEFRNTYGSFGERQPYFASTVNADKTFNVTMTEIPDCPNLSVLYSNVNSNISYHGHFKQEYYPLEIMFKGYHGVDGAYSFMYISQSQADILLRERGVVVTGEDGYTEEQYETLIGTHTTVNLNGTEYEFSIGDIYLEQNYYYNGLTQVMKDFVMMYNRFPEGIKRQGLYFFDNQAFHNEYFIGNINDKYSSEYYSMRVNKINVVGEIDEDRITSLYYDRSSSDALHVTGVVLLIALVILLAGFSLYLCRRYELAERKINLLIVIPFAFTPYLIFKLIFAITGNIYLYSNIGMLTMALTIVAYLLGYAIVAVWKKDRKERKKQ